MNVTAGETVLLREGETCRWVTVVQAGAPKPNGTQAATVQSVDQYGRAKPRRVTLGGTAHVEQVL